MSSLAICSGEISTTVDGVATCSTGWMQATYILPFDVTQLDPVVALGFSDRVYALFNSLGNRLGTHSTCKCN